MEAKQQQDLLKIMDALGMQKKSNESMSSAQASYGDEFVPTEMAAEVIKKARDESRVLAALPSSNLIDMPTNPYQFPLEGADPTFYYTGENTDVTGTAVTTSKAGTSNLTFTAKKFSASVYLSGELEEDAKIAGGIRQYVTDKLGEAYGELADKALILGDTVTAGTGNINSDDGAPSAGSYYLAFDGLVKTARTNSLTTDAGTLDTGDFMKARSLLGGKKGANPSKLLFIMNPETYFKAMQLAQVETMEKFGSAATIENGVLKAIYGVPVVVNSDFGLTEADGKVSTTPANNTKGRFACIYTPKVYVGWRRRLKLTVRYLEEYDQWRIVAHTRMCAVIAETDSVSYAYDITV
jgi:HK97 family phage major capsid protein